MSLTSTIASGYRDKTCPCLLMHILLRRYKMHAESPLQLNTESILEGTDGSAGALQDEPMDVPSQGTVDRFFEAVDAEGMQKESQECLVESPAQSSIEACLWEIEQEGNLRNTHGNTSRSAAPALDLPADSSCNSRAMSSSALSPQAASVLSVLQTQRPEDSVTDCDAAPVPEPPAGLNPSGIRHSQPSSYKSPAIGMLEDIPSQGTVDWVFQDVEAEGVQMRSRGSPVTSPSRSSIEACLREMEQEGHVCHGNIFFSTSRSA